MATVSDLQQRFVLRDADWSTYRALRSAFGDRPIRVTYDRGVLEIVSPSDMHERLKKLLDRMLQVLSEELRMPIRSQGSTTFGRETLDRALEPDECYYIRNEQAVRGRDSIDPSVDPPPDLAVEIDITASSLDRLDIYAALGVPEVWRFDGEKLEIHHLRSTGEYETVERSLAFPAIEPVEFTRHLERRNDMDESTWVAEFRRRVRTLLNPAVE